MTDKTSWDVSNAKAVFASLTKIANDMLDSAAQAPSPESAGTAGPQEVVDALSVIVDELEQVQAAIPAEPSNQEEEAPVESPQAPVESPQEPAVVAKLQTQIAELESKLENTERESIATRYAELYDDAKVKQAKYDEVMSSSEKPSFWSAKIEAIESFTTETGVKSYKPAKQTSTWLKPMTRVAKQGSEMVRL